jgi:hypothetical protein
VRRHEPRDAGIVPAQLGGVAELDVLDVEVHFDHQSRAERTLDQIRDVASRGGPVGPQVVPQHWPVTAPPANSMVYVALTAKKWCLGWSG